MIDVVGNGASGDEALVLVRERRPDVLLMDVEMPGPGAEATLRALFGVSPETAVIILTMHDYSSIVSSLLRLGAASYLVKSVDHHELLAAVHSAARNRSTVTVSVSRTTIDHLNRRDEAPVEELFSPREMEVLRLLAQARSNAEIGADLFISQGTVKRHLTNLYGKLDANGRVDAMVKARAGRPAPGPGPAREEARTRCITGQ